MAKWPKKYTLSKSNPKNSVSYREVGFTKKNWPFGHRVLKRPLLWVAEILEGIIEGIEYDHYDLLPFSLERRTMGLERDFQPKLIKEIEALFPNCLVQKNDANYRQGVPDLLVLYRGRWALLEVKKSADAPSRPNQPWYVAYGQQNSFGAFVYPENKSVVLEELFDFFN